MSEALRITPGPLSGEVLAPPSKSYAHRTVICAALARGGSVVRNLELSRDMEATLCAMRALGAGASLESAKGCRVNATISGAVARAQLPLIDCGESGSTLRFLIPVTLALCGGAVFTGTGRLGQRPLGPYFDLFRARGISVEQGPGGFPLTVRGELKPGRFVVPGNVSSQFITGLVLAAPVLGGQSEILVKGMLESADYVRITLDAMRSFGADAREEVPCKQYVVDGSKGYRPLDYTVEGDWSQAAFPLLMGLLGGEVRVGGLNPGSCQGDRVIEEVFRMMGGGLRWDGGVLVASRSRLCAAAVDVSQCPDLAPAIAAAMAAAEGESRITGGARLRDKESDRIESVASCLNALGADVAETADGMVIHGKPALSGGVADSRNDHRIAMMTAGVSPHSVGAVVLHGYHAVSKSWPGFWETFRCLGGVFDEQPVGE